MTDQINEKLSAFVDGELNANESDRLISDILSSDELRSRWAEYHVMRDTMQSQSGPVDASLDMAARVSAALENEPTVLSPTKKHKTIPAVAKQIAGMAIAATVAASAVLVMQAPQQALIASNETQPKTLVQQPAAQVSNVASVNGVSPDASQGQWIRANDGVTWSVDRPSVASKLNTYLVNHNGYSTSLRGHMPYAPIVSQEEHFPAEPAKAIEYNDKGNQELR